MKKTYQFGLLAEKISIIFLRLKLYRILKWRHKTYFGEIDIIAQKSNYIIFVEVKARRTKTNIEDILRPKQIRRLKRAGEFFIAKNPQFHKYSLRYDFIEVGRFFYPKHYRNFIS